MKHINRITLLNKVKDPNLPAPILEAQFGCFTSVDFEERGSNNAIRRVFSLLKREKVIRRLAQGIYDYPKELEGVGLTAADYHKRVMLFEQNPINHLPLGNEMSAFFIE